MRRGRALYLGREAALAVAFSPRIVDSSPATTSVRARIEQALERLRPALQADGGDVELIEVDGSVARVKMLGACGGCPMSLMTLKAGIEAAIMDAVPEISSVEAA